MKRELTTNELQYLAHLLVKAYKKEIVRDGDWWFGVDDYDFNFHDLDNTGYFNIDIYARNGEGDINYSHGVCDFQPIYLGGKNENMEN